MGHKGIICSCVLSYSEGKTQNVIFTALAKETSSYMSLEFSEIDFTEVVMTYNKAYYSVDEYTP